MEEASGGVFRGEGTEGVGESVLEGRQGAGFEYAQSLFELRPAFFDGVEVGRVRWQIEQCCPGLPNTLGHAVDLVRGQVVHDNNLAGPELGTKNVLEVSQEDVSVGSRFDRHGGDPAGNTDRTQHAQGSPVTCRNAFTEPRTTRDATVAPCHFRRDATLIEEDESCRVNLFDFFLPELSLGSDPLAILFSGVE